MSFVMQTNKENISAILDFWIPLSPVLGWIDWRAIIYSGMTAQLIVIDFQFLLFRKQNKQLCPILRSISFYLAVCIHTLLNRFFT